MFSIEKRLLGFCRNFLTSEGMSPVEWQIGKSKVFLRGCVFEPLEERRQRVLNSSATKIQVNWGKLPSLVEICTK